MSATMADAADRRHARARTEDGCSRRRSARWGIGHAGIGHNGGPPLQEELGPSWGLWCWRRARKTAWSAPREVTLRRLERAEALGMTYRDYTLEILERGRHP